MVKMVNSNRDLSKRPETFCSNEEAKAIAAWEDPTRIGKATNIEIKQMLVVVFSYIGLTNFPDKGQEVTLLEFMRANYAPFTLKEMALAFEMAALGKLDFEKGKGQHYQQFSPAYFAEIMNAYKVWVTEVRKQYDKPAPFTPKVSITENQWRGQIQKTYEAYTEKTNWKLWPVEFYDQLQRDGFIPMQYHLTHLKEARQILCSDIHMKIVNEKDDLKIKSLESLLVEYRERHKEAEVIFLAKQLSVRELFMLHKIEDHRGFYEQ